MTTEVELIRTDEAGGIPGSVLLDTRTWCLDCYDRREAWVLRTLSELGVEFRHAVLEEAGECRSCRARLPPGLHAIVVTIPTSGPARP